MNITKVERNFVCKCGNENRIIIETNLESMKIICSCSCGRKYEFAFGKLAEGEIVEEKEMGGEKTEEKGRDEEGERESEDLVSKMKKEEEIKEYIAMPDEEVLSSLFGVR